MTSEPKDPTVQPAAKNRIGLWLAVGAVLGATLGAALDDLPLGLGLGIAIGVLVGALQSRKGTKEQP